jgi:hypothetical protein
LPVDWFPFLSINLDRRLCSKLDVSQGASMSFVITEVITN